MLTSQSWTLMAMFSVLTTGMALLVFPLMAVLLNLLKRKRLRVGMPTWLKRLPRMNYPQLLVSLSRVLRKILSLARNGLKTAHRVYDYWALRLKFRASKAQPMAHLLKECPVSATRSCWNPYCAFRRMRGQSYCPLTGLSKSE